MIGPNKAVKGRGSVQASLMSITPTTSLLCIDEEMTMNKCIEVQLQVQEDEVNDNGIVNECVYSKYCQQGHHQLLENVGLALGGAFTSTTLSTFTSKIHTPLQFISCSKKWPEKLSFKLMSQFVLIALSGVTTFQALMLLGMEKTSPAIASAMPNAAPGIIFIIAACLRFEKIDMNCKYTRAKILGTITCLSGAVTMSFLQSPKDESENVSHVGTEWIIGCLYLLTAVLVVSCSTVLQAVTMISFPAPFSLCSITSFLGMLFSIVVQIMTDGKVGPGTPVINLGSIIAIMLLGGMVIALCVSFQTWAVKKKGPVLVSMFCPVQTVCSALLSAIFLGQVIQVGSVIGMFVMFSGLYMVLWAKNKEGCILSNVSTDDSTQSGSDEDLYDVEKPLLN